MSKYNELSDFEINKKVADKLDIDYTTDNIGNLIIYKHSSPVHFNPCNNHCDGIPIIIDNRISLMADMSDDGGSTWWCASDISNGISSRYKSNPLRACMEVFLMMKDAEN